MSPGPALEKLNDPRMPPACEAYPGKRCSMPCPKCGSEDIHRRYRRKDEEWNKDIGDYECRDTERVEDRTYHARAKVECLVHHCRCCDYEWDSECESNPCVLPPAAPAGREQRVVGGPND